jgi:hypothetical protein
MARHWKIAIAALVVAVIVGLISFGGLRQRVRLLSQSQNVEEQARREVLAPPITTPSDTLSTAKIFWAAGPDKVAESDIQLPLSADLVQRAKQVLHALIVSPPSDAQRTLPSDVELLAFYILPDGTAIADFSDALASETPSGILSEQLTVDSIAQTLENNVPSLKRLKILIHGQEVETLAGHVDLTGFFDLNSSAAAAQGAPDSNPAPAANASSPAASVSSAPIAANPSAAPAAPSPSGASQPAKP